MKAREGAKVEDGEEVLLYLGVCLGDGSQWGSWEGLDCGGGQKLGWISCL